MNLLILSWQYPPDASGGTEIATRELARALSRRGYHVEIVTTRDSQRRETDSCGRVVVHFVSRRRWRLLTYGWLMAAAVRACRHTRIDVVHAQALWMGPIALAIRICHGIPYVLWGRGEDVRHPRMCGGPVRWASLRGASAVLALNPSMGLHLTRHGARGVRVLGNGAGLRGMCACSRTSARMRLGVPPSARVVVFVGALTRAKGVATLLRAFAQVCGSRRDTLLLVVGDGPLLKTLRAYAQSKCPSSSVVFAGAIPHENVGVYLSAADVFALPSAAEGFPMSVAEAMAIGLPVVCTGVGALPDIVRDGVNGHLVRAGDANALGDAFSSLLDNPGVVAEMGRKNRAWARRHSWDDVAERFAGVCAEVIVRRAETTESPSERFDKYGIHA